MLGPIALDASFLYVAQQDGCKDTDPGPRGNGGVWRIDRTTGHAERIGRDADLVRDMLPRGSTLWLSTVPAWCQRASSHGIDGSIIALPLGGARPRRLDLSSGDAPAGPLLPAREAIDYATRGGTRGPADVSKPVPGVVRLDEGTMMRSRIACGVPLASARVGDAFYFLEEPSGHDPQPGEVDLFRVSVRGGDAELLADDLTDARTFVQVGGDVVVKTKPHGIRAYSLSGAGPVARELVAGDGDAWNSVRDIVVARGAVVYVVGHARLQEVRAVPLTGGASWQVAPPHRDPRGLVADDAGVFWVNLVDPERDPNRDGVFACETNAH